MELLCLALPCFCLPEDELYLHSSAYTQYMYNRMVLCGTCSYIWTYICMIETRPRLYRTVLHVRMCGCGGGWWSMLCSRWYRCRNWIKFYLFHICRFLRIWVLALNVLPYKMHNNYILYIRVCAYLYMQSVYKASHTALWRIAISWDINAVAAGRKFFMNGFCTGVGKLFIYILHI